MKIFDPIYQRLSQNGLVLYFSLFLYVYSFSRFYVLFEITAYYWNSHVMYVYLFWKNFPCSTSILYTFLSTYSYSFSPPYTHREICIYIYFFFLQVAGRLHHCGDTSAQECKLKLEALLSNLTKKACLCCFHPLFFDSNKQVNQIDIKVSTLSLQWTLLVSILSNFEIFVQVCL